MGHNYERPFLYYRDLVRAAPQYFGNEYINNIVQPISSWNISLRLMRGTVRGTRSFQILIGRGEQLSSVFETCILRKMGYKILKTLF